MKATLIALLFAAASVYAAPDRTQQTRGQVEDDSNWDVPAPILPAAPSVGILPAPVVPSRVVYVTPSNTQRAPAGGVKGGAAGGSYDAPAPHHPKQFVQAVATPLGLQCYLNNPHALQSLLAPATGEPQLVAVYDQPAPVAESPIRDQGVKSQYDGARKSRYPSAAPRPAGGSQHGGSHQGSQPVGGAGGVSGSGDQTWWQNTQQQRAPQGSQQAKGYRQVSVNY